MAKKKKNGFEFGLDLNLFSLIVGGLAIAAVVIFFTCPFITLKGSLTEVNYSFLDLACGTKLSAGAFSVETLKADPCMWALLAAPILIAALALLTKGGVKHIINLILAVVGIVFVLVCANNFAGKIDSGIFDVLSAVGYITAVIYLGIAAVSIVKIVK